MEDYLKDYFPRGVLPEMIYREKTRRIIVLGGSDTGKTTLLECLADVLSRSAPVGLVDLDAGQSTIGPPTTTAWARIKDGLLEVNFLVQPVGLLLYNSP